MARITEIKTVKINDGCGENPVYLCWLNKLGGISYWLFNRYKTEKTKTSINFPFSSNISNLETDQGNINISGKGVQPSYEIGASIPIADMDGIRGLYESGKVLMLANPTTWTTDGVKWKRVIITAGSLVVLKKDTSFYDVRLTLNLPELYNQIE